MAIRDENGYSKTTISIGVWDMNADSSKAVAHGLSSVEWKTIREISTIIRNDVESYYHDLERVTVATGVSGGSVDTFDATNIVLVRHTGGTFDGVLFDDTSALAEDTRGWVTFEYIAD